jgi:hypothetical protein
MLLLVGSLINKLSIDANISSGKWIRDKRQRVEIVRFWSLASQTLLIYIYRRVNNLIKYFKYFTFWELRRRYIFEWRLFVLLSLKLVQKSRYICKISSYTGILRYNIVVSCMITSDHCSTLSTSNSANIQIDELFRDYICY